MHFTIYSQPKVLKVQPPKQKSPLPEKEVSKPKVPPPPVPTSADAPSQEAKKPASPPAEQPPPKGSAQTAFGGIMRQASLTGFFAKRSGNLCSIFHLESISKPYLFQCRK